MKLDDIQKQYDNLETATDKYNFWKEVQKIDKYMEKDFYNNITWCGCCKMHIYKKDLVKTLDVWKETVCTNPLMGYLDDYEYKEEEFVNFRYHCPKCNGVIRYSK